jgi:hypothetical protein
MSIKKAKEWIEGAKSRIPTLSTGQLAEAEKFLNEALIEIEVEESDLATCRQELAAVREKLTQARENCVALTDAGRAWREEAAAAEARERKVREILEVLVDKYIANRGSDGEFVTCITPKGIPDYWRQAQMLLDGEQPGHAALAAALEARTVKALNAVLEAIERGHSNVVLGDWSDRAVTNFMNVVEAHQAALEQARDELRQKVGMALDEIPTFHDEVERTVKNAYKALGYEVNDDK